MGICFYPPLEFHNRSSIEDAVDPMAEWATLVVLEWQYKLAEKEAIFRRCACKAPRSIPARSLLCARPRVPIVNTINLRFVFASSRGAHEPGHDQPRRICHPRCFDR